MDGVLDSVAAPAPASPHRSRWAIVLGVVVLAGLVVLSMLDSSPESPGPYSALDRAEIEQLSAGTALLVPAELPDGLDEDASSREFLGSYEIDGDRYDGDEIAFQLHRVIAAGDVPAPQREIVSSYRSTVLDSSGHQRFEVHQLPEKHRGRAQCSKGSAALITRQIDGIRLLICARDLQPNSVAWRYWSTVPFTDQLDEVGWLRGDAA